jgi:hypothetical protein
VYWSCIGEWKCMIQYGTKCLANCMCQFVTFGCIISSIASLSQANRQFTSAFELSVLNKFTWTVVRRERTRIHSGRQRISDWHYSKPLEPKRKTATVLRTQSASDATVLLLLLRSYGEMEVKLNAYFLWALDGEEWLVSYHDQFIAWERTPDVNRRADTVNSTVDLEVVAKQKFLLCWCCCSLAFSLLLLLLLFLLLLLNLQWDIEPSKLIWFF